MESSLADNHANASMSLNNKILQVARHQHIYSHFARCTWVPWHSLTSLVSYLTLVNDIHQWSVIQWFLFMLDLDTYIRMIRTVPLGFVVGEYYTIFSHDSISSCRCMTSNLWEYCSSTFLLPYFPSFISSSSYSSTSHYSSSSSYIRNNIYSYIFTLQ